MKANEILIRQDRVVYALMLLFASLGLVWSLWQHQQSAATADVTPRAQPAATKTPVTNTGYTH